LHKLRVMTGIEKMLSEVVALGGDFLRNVKIHFPKKFSAASVTIPKTSFTRRNLSRDPEKRYILILIPEEVGEGA